jgi:hypothetical protein
MAVEAEVMLEGVIKRREIRFAQAGLAEQFIDWRGGAGGQEFAVRIAPAILAAGA